MAQSREGASLLKTVKEKVFSATQQEISFHDITRSSKLLRNVESEEVPCLEEVDFYQGYRAPEHDYVPQSVKICHMSDQQKGLKHAVQLSQVLNNFKRGQITFIGCAGSGKTTLLKLIARGIIAEKWPGLKDVEFVHFLQGRNLCQEGDKSPAKFLLDQCDLTDRETNEYIRFIRKNPKKVIFIIDSLDTLPYELENEAKSMGIYDSGSPGRILWNLLTGNLFPRSRIISSSREHKIRHFRNQLRADHVIALVGLTTDSIKRIVVGYFGWEEGAKIVQHLEMKSPALVTLCSTPVFLSFTLMGLDDDDFAPSTMSGIMVSLLRSLVRSEHAHVENITDVICKLAQLSFDGSRDGIVVFPASMLAGYGLTENEVTDLTVVAPGGRSHKLLQHENVLFFCHQSIQEALAAFHIAQMPQEDFKTFVNNFLHTPHYAVIRRILCGIMLDEDVLKASQMLVNGDQQYCEKQVFLKQSLKNELGRVMRGADQLELLISFNEARNGVNDIIASSMRDMDVQELPLLKSDIYAVGSILGQCTALNRMSLRKCSLDETKLNILLSSVQKSNVQIHELNLWGNDTMDAAGMSCVGQLTRISNAQWLGLGYCDISPEQLEAFRIAVANYKLPKLVLWANKNIGTDGMSVLGRIVKECQVDILSIGDCSLEPDHVFALVESIGPAKLSELDLRYNVKLGIEGMLAVGKLIQLCQLDSLNIGECGLTEEQLIALKEATGNAKIVKLDLQGNKTIGTGGMAVIGEIAKQNHVEALHLGYLDLRSNDLVMLKESLNGAKISEISLYENKNMGIDGMSIVGDIAKLCQVGSVDFTNCGLTSHRLLAFEAAAAGTKLSKLNLHDNESLGSDGMAIVGETARNCNVEILDVSDCALNLGHLVALEKSLKDAKLQVADLGVSVLSCAKVPTTEEISVIARLLKHIKQELTLSRWKVEEKSRHLLQQELDKAENCGLIIRFGHDDVLSSRYQKENEPPDMAQRRCRNDEVDSALQETGDLTALFLPGSERVDEETVIEQEIGPEGGVVKVDGCVVTFSPGAVDDITLFRFAMGLESQIWPSEYVGITPRLSCTPSMTFGSPVKISLPTWCFSASDEVMVYVMYQDNKDTHLHTMQTLLLKETNGTVVFECNHFTSFWAFIKSLFLGEVEFKMLPELYYNLQGNFSVVFHLDDATVASKCRQELREHNFEPAPVVFGAMTLKQNDELMVHLRCQSHRQYRLVPAQRRFVMGKDVVENSSDCLRFLLRNIPEPEELLVMLCQMRNRNVEFNLLWPEPVKPVFNGDIQTENLFCGPVTILQTKEHDEHKERHGIDSLFILILVAIVAVVFFAFGKNPCWQF